MPGAYGLGTRATLRRGGDACQHASRRPVQPHAGAAVATDRERATSQGTEELVARKTAVGV